MSLEDTQVRKRKGASEKHYTLDGFTNLQENEKKSSPLMSITKVILKMMIATFVLLGIYIAITPSPIDPGVLELDTPLPRFEGVLAPNDKLKQARRIGEGKLLAPESLAMDKEGNIYSGLGDGRIVKITKDEEIINITRTGEPHPECGKREVGSKCGRPLGIHFDKDQKNLIICDAFFGLLKLNIATKKLSTLVGANVINEKPLKFTNHISVSSKNVVYFSDSSSRWDLENVALLVLEGNGDGRLMSYDMESGKLQILLEGIYFANGVSLSPDEDFVLVCEMSRNRIIRYYLKGENKGNYDIFADNLPGSPDNIRRSPNGGYWLALPSIRKAPFSPPDLIAPYPSIRNVIAKLLSPQTLEYLLGSMRYGMIIKLDENGKVVESYHDKDGSKMYTISEVYEDSVNKVLYLGSYKNPFMGKLQLSDSS